MFGPPGGERGPPPGVDIVDARPEKKKGDKKRAKKTLGFFSGAKPPKKSSSKKWVNADEFW